MTAGPERFRRIRQWAIAGFEYADPGPHGIEGFDPLEMPAMMEMHVCNRRGVLLKAFALGDEAELIVGRDDSCDVQIRARSISREHCSIERSDSGLVLRDLDSTSGIFVQGQRVKDIQLEDGIEIIIGPAVLKFYETDI